MKYQEWKRFLYFNLYRALEQKNEEVPDEDNLEDQVARERAVEQVLKELRRNAGPKWPW